MGWIICEIKSVPNEAQTVAMRSFERTYNANSNTTGVYLIAHIPLFGEKLLLSPSVRYDHYDTSSKTVKYKDNHLSPATKLTWIVTNWLDFTAKYNEAFRAPSMQERFASGAHFGTTILGSDRINKFVANPNLRPETAKNKEITANLHFDSLFKQGDKFKIEATYFRNDVKDFINLKYLMMQIQIKVQVQMEHFCQQNPSIKT